MNTRLFVGGLPWAADDQDLRSAFEPFGTVTDAVIIKDRETGRSRGFGFVTYASEEGAKKAVENMDGAEMGGRPVRVHEAEGRGGPGGPPRRPSGPGGSTGDVVYRGRAGSPPPRRGGGYGDPPGGGGPGPGGYGGPSGGGYGGPSGGGYGGRPPTPFIAPPPDGEEDEGKPGRKKERRGKKKPRANPGEAPSTTSRKSKRRPHQRTWDDDDAGFDPDGDDW